MMRITKVVMGWLLVLGLTSSSVATASQPYIYKVEEDWELVINQPDPASNSPQVTFSTYPSSSSTDSYFQLQMNYAADTGYSEGGFHVAAIQNDAMIDENRSATRSVLSTDGDTIRWTSIMAIIDGNALFAIKDGHGTQWGDFGGPEYLVKILSSPISDLSLYHPQQSLDAVDIGFGANRVASITLREVRAFYSNGQTVVVAVNQNP